MSWMDVLVLSHILQERFQTTFRLQKKSLHTHTQTHHINFISALEEMHQIELLLVSILFICLDVIHFQSWQDVCLWSFIYLPGSRRR